MTEQEFDQFLYENPLHADSHKFRMERPNLLIRNMFPKCGEYIVENLSVMQKLGLLVMMRAYIDAGYIGYEETIKNQLEHDLDIIQMIYKNLFYLNDARLRNMFNFVQALMRLEGLPEVDSTVVNSENVH